MGHQTPSALFGRINALVRTVSNAAGAPFVTATAVGSLDVSVPAVLQNNNTYP